MSAQFSLPFTVPEHFGNVWSSVLASLRSGGIFADQLFGFRDDWFGRPGIVFHSAEEIVELVAELSLLKSEEREYIEKPIAASIWHYYDLILKKP